MPTSRIVFNKKALIGLEPPASGRAYVYDCKTPALTICVTSTGRKTFYLYRRVNGRPVRTKIGSFPQISVEQARKIATGHNAKVSEGIDPNEDRRGPTFDEVFDTYMTTHAKVYKRTWREDQRCFDKYLTDWHGRRLRSIKHTDVVKLHGRIGRDNGGYQANRVHEIIRALFNFAIRHGFTKENPALGVKRFTEQSRERFLSADEVRRLFHALDDEPGDVVRDAVCLLLFIGARLSNVLGMAWADLDVERGLWRIPHEKSKSDRPLLLVLAEPARDILQRRAMTKAGPWVFPADTKSGHVVGLRSAWKRVCERAKIADLRLHDLRRSLGSWMAGAGSSLPVIGRALGHANPRTTAIYARLDLEPVRRGVETATSRMLESANGNGGER